MYLAIICLCFAVSFNGLFSSADLHQSLSENLASRFGTERLTRDTVADLAGGASVRVHSEPRAERINLAPGHANWRLAL
jgi:hypothetical protein